MTIVIKSSASWAVKIFHCFLLIQNKMSWEFKSGDGDLICMKIDLSYQLEYHNSFQPNKWSRTVRQVKLSGLSQSKIREIGLLLIVTEKIVIRQVSLVCQSWRQEIEATRTFSCHLESPARRMFRVQVIPSFFTVCTFRSSYVITVVCVPITLPPLWVRLVARSSSSTLQYVATSQIVCLCFRE